LFGKEKKLYRVEIIEDVQYFSEKTLWGWALANNFRNPFEFIKQNGVWRYKPKEGIIKKGIKGYVVIQWGMKWFSPDEEQENIELFTPCDNPLILVPFKKIENKYIIINENLVEAK
jgi:hypothetical protein